MVESSPTLGQSLQRAIESFVDHDQVLVAMDFDGTLAPLVDDPMKATALPGSLALVGELAQLPGVSVAIVSGRALETLTTLTEAQAPIVLIGSHGAESSRSNVDPADDEARAKLETLDTALQEALAEHPDVRLERKPTSVVLHTRGVADPGAQAAMQAARSVAADHGVSITPGKDVLEMAVTEAGKGPSLLGLAETEQASAILYLGDDVTDERAFASLRDQDLTIRVGQGETVAAHRVADESGVVAVLEHLLSERRSRT